MKTIRGEILEVGVDWITAVALSKEAREELEPKCAVMLDHEHQCGNDLTPWRFAGYEGFKSGGVQFGTRYDSCCVRVSGATADDYWRQLWRDCEKVTRLDVQVTVRTTLPVARAIGVVHRCALRESAKRKDGARVTMIRSNDGGCTVYLGSRQSEVFGRVYTKGFESQLDHYDGTLRFEVEIKGSLCHDLLRRMCRDSNEIAAVAGYICGFFSKRGVELEIPSVNKYTARVSRPASDDETRLAWLAVQVRPSIETLVHHGRLASVVESLGLSEYVTVRET